MKIGELREQRADLVGKMEALNQKIGEAKATTEQRTKWNDLKSQIEDLDETISFEEQREQHRLDLAQIEADRLERERRQSRENRRKDDEKELAGKISLVRAIRSKLNNSPLDGAEAEAFQEAQSEARSFGKDLSGNVAVPSWAMEQRDQIVGTAGAGGNMVFQDFGGHFASLQPRPVVEAAGATVLRNLTSNVRFTKNSAVTASWEGEQDENAEVNTTIGVMDLSPNRVGAKTHNSKQLILQSSPDVENILRNE